MCVCVRVYACISYMCDAMMYVRVCMEVMRKNLYTCAFVADIVCV